MNIFRSRHHYLIYILVSWLALGFVGSAAGDYRQKTYKIGVLAYKGKDDAIARWAGHARFLNYKLFPAKFEIIPLSYKNEELTRAVKNNKIDFVITNSGHFTELELSGHLVHLATRRVEGPYGVLDKFGGTVITRPENEQINHYRDLADASIAIPSMHSLGGWQVHLREALQQGIDLRTDAKIIELKSHKKVIDAVLKAEVDAGFIRSDLIEELQQRNMLDPLSLKIVNPVKTAQYPYLLSTRLYPEWPFAMVNGTDPEVGSRVLHALLEMDKQDSAARQAKIHGWTIPGSYSEINKLFLETNLGPYKKPEMTTTMLAKSFWKEALIIVFAFAMTIFWFSLRASRAEQKSLHEEYERKIAEQKNLAKSEFLASMSHELRTPMHAILSFTALALKKIDNRQKTEKFLNNIRTSAIRLTDLLNDLLDLSKLESGKMQPDFIQHDIASVIDHAINDVSSLARDKNISINFVKQEALQCMLDQKLIIQVIVNLLSNAIKFSDNNSTIDLAVFKTSKFLDKKLQNMLQIEVIDHGFGIPEKEIDSIFDKFIQSSKNKSQKGGTGLGLPISREIIELHQGKIWAESPPKDQQQGTAFIILMPLFQGIPNQVAFSNIEDAVAAHLEWSTFIDEMFATKKVPVDIPNAIITDDKVCSLGQWLDDNPFDDELVKQLKKVHKDFHVEAGECVAYFSMGDYETAASKREYVKLKSAKITELLRSMNFIEWSEVFSVGVPELDVQHKHIIELINQITMDNNARDDSVKTGALMDKLMAYVSEHLQYEENLLQENNYPDFDAHKQLHLKYQDRFNQLHQLRNSNNAQFVLKLKGFLHDWWEHHILEEDMKYKPFFEKKFHNANRRNTNVVSLIGK